MATLVLTIVGSVLGGPVGAAIGGLAGRAIDSQIFKPKGREGPRLTDLSVQTSSYGSPIPRVFGTMRIAGTVIWSTDLIETRNKASGGKGQPSVTTYSYAASFAVLLSSRRIERVGRIWADGKLLRGAGGDFKSQTGFRLYPGDEAQAVDPLIASAEGLAMTPAYRGGAYAVFEDFQLADYGNRIPSLTFEVVADAAPVAIGAIAGEISDGLVDGSEVAATLSGFSAYGDKASDVLAILATAAEGWIAPSGSRLALRSNRAPVRALNDEGFAVAGRKGGKNGRKVRSVAAAETVARTLSVAHYDPARDYQTGIQRARRPGPGSGTSRIDLPAAIDAGRAKQIAETALASADVAREHRSLSLSWAEADLTPGAVVTVEDEAGLWRIENWSLEAMVLSLDLSRLSDAAGATESATSGRVLGAPDRLIGETVVAAFELPSLTDAALATPRLLIAAGGTQPGWRQAALLLSTDGGARFEGLGATAAPAVVGAVIVPPAVAAATLIDRISLIDVELTHPAMVLSPADDAALDAGFNLALIGDELIQFAAVEQLGATRWRLRGLWRARRGTEAAIAGHVAGERFVMIGADSLMATDLPQALIGGQAIVLASGSADAEAASADAPITGMSVCPPSPVHVRMAAKGGQIELDWARRSRLGWRWQDGIDAPIGEQIERYRVTAILPDGSPFEAVTRYPAISLPQAVVPPGTAITLRQLGDICDSPSAMLVLDY